MGFMKKFYPRNEEIRALKRENEQFVEEIKILNEQIISQNNINDRMRESAHLTERWLESKELRMGPQASDDTILSGFRGTLDEIRTWSLRFASDHPVDLSLIPPEIMTTFQKLAPASTDLSKLLSQRKARRLFVRGWVSLVMAESLFRYFPSEHHPGSVAVDRWLPQELAESSSLIEDHLFDASKL